MDAVDTGFSFIRFVEEYGICAGALVLLFIIVIALAVWAYKMHERLKALEKDDRCDKHNGYFNDVFNRVKELEKDKALTEKDIEAIRNDMAELKIDLSEIKADFKAGQAATNEKLDKIIFMFYGQREKI